jgi:hypothetical protein
MKYHERLKQAQNLGCTCMIFSCKIHLMNVYVSACCNPTCFTICTIVVWDPEAQDPPQIRPTTWLILDRCFIYHVTLLIRNLNMHFMSEDN